LLALRGEHIFEKRTQNEHLTIKLLNLIHHSYTHMLGISADYTGIDEYKDHVLARTCTHHM